MKRLFFSFAWIFLTVGVMLTSIAGYEYLLMPKDEVEPDASSQQILGASRDRQLLSFLDESNSNTETIVAAHDARAEIVARFLERYNSPLTPYDYYGQVFVDLADEHDFDFRLLPAIAMQESNLCKSIPEGSYNCLGFGIHERGTLAFESFEANFDRAARELKLYYIDQGLTTPAAIMTKYTPSSDGSWADSVNQWMTEMRFNDRELGRELDHNNSVLEFTR